MLLLFIISPNRYYYFMGLIIYSRIHPVWCIISIAAFIFQIVLVTVLLYIDAKNGKNLKRDFIATTALGLYCLCMSLLPSLNGLIGLTLGILDEPVCTVYSDNDRCIVIREGNRLYENHYNIYLLHDDDSVSSLSIFDADYIKDITWQEDSIIIRYILGNHGTMERERTVFLDSRDNK